MTPNDPYELIKAITFDAAGTLIHLSEPVGQSYSKVAAEFGICASPEALTRAFGIVWKRTPLPFSDPNRERDPHEKAWWHRLVREVFIEAGAALPSPQRYDSFFESLYQYFESPGTWEAEVDAAETLSILSTHFRCIVLSNFDGRLRKILNDLKLLDYFETCLLSCELGASKPAPEVFNAAEKWLQLPPEFILHVGDDAYCDGEGASNAGFAHFRVGNGGKKIGDLIEELSLAPL